MQRKGLFLAVLCGLVMAFIGWSLWSARERDRRNSRTLVDGSVVRLKAVAFGRELRVRTGNRWRDYLGMALPEAWATKLDARISTFAGGGDTLTIWLEWKNYPAARPDLRTAMFDSHGCELGMDWPSQYQPFSPGGGEAVICRFNEFPRREKTLGLRLYQRGTNQTWTAIAEFQVPNPKPKSAPVWNAEAKPIKRTIEDQGVRTHGVEERNLGADLATATAKAGRRSRCGRQLSVAVEWRLGVSEL
jgi:hypothetical protein